jgi:hypothetical protein
MSSRNAVLFASLVIATVGRGATGQPYQYGDYPLKPIQFSAGESSAIISDSVERGASATYSLNAKAGQKAEFHLSSVEHNALFTVYLPGAALKKGDGGIDVEGETLPGANAGTGASQWTGTLRRMDNTSSPSLQRAEAPPTSSPSQSSKNRTFAFENRAGGSVYAR